VGTASASFQEAVIEVLVDKTITVARERQVRQILLAGGVASNGLLRQRLLERSPLPVLVPAPVLCTITRRWWPPAATPLPEGETGRPVLDVVPDLKLV